MSNEKIFLKLLKHFQSKSNQLNETISETAIHENKSDLGTLREEALQKYLEGYLPTSCKISKGGFIFDSEQNQSDQMDLLVTNNFTLQFQNDDTSSKTFNCIEGIVCAISVKTNLTKAELYNSLKNISSIPTKKEFIKINFATKNIDELIKQVPLKVIFAYHGLDFKLTYSHMQDYFKESKITFEQKPDLIIVNNKFIFHKVYAGTKAVYSGKPLEEGKFVGYGKEQTDYVGGRALLTILTRIQRVNSYLADVELNFGDYLDNMKRADPTWKGPK